jgi:hypothetical protein
MPAGLFSTEARTSMKVEVNTAIVRRLIAGTALLCLTA